MWHRSLQIKTLALSILILSIFDCFAQNDAFQVKDINTASGPATITGSNPVLKAALNGIVYFVADDGAHGNELWRTDGTEGGTFIVKDINPGGSSSFISELIVFNGILLFPAGDAEHGMELWKSDGTDEGTVLVADIFPGGLGSNPEGLTTNDEAVFFAAVTPATGKEPWRSDGETSGTNLIKDIKPGSAGSDPDMLQYVGSHIYFGATTTEFGHELWRSNGQIGNAELVIDSYPGEQGVTITELIALDEKIIFTTIVPDPRYLEEQLTFYWGKMWVWDIVSPSPEVMIDLTENGYGYGTYPTNFTYHDHKVFYTQIPGPDIWTPGALINWPILWSTDGTTPGTKPVEDVLEKTYGAQGLVSYEGYLYFFSYSIVDGFPDHNVQMVKTDGTSSGTTIVKSSLSPAGSEIRTNVVNDKLYIVSEHMGAQSGLWQSDGTEGGTQLITGGPLSSYLVAEDQFYLGTEMDNLGSELYLVDQATSTLRLIKDIRSSTAEGSSSPSLLSEYEGKLHFRADNQLNYYGLWVSDGTSDGTTLLVDQNVDCFARANGVLYFSSGPNLYKKESNQITLIKVFPAPPPSGYITGISGLEIIPYKTLVFIVVRETGYFPGLPTSYAGFQLWRSDGTETGTFLIDRIYQADRFVNSSLRLFKDNLFFWTSKGLTKTDGTLEGTHLVKDVFPPAWPRDMAEMNGNLYFVGADEEIWRTDGTSANTFRVGDIQLPYALNTNYLTAVKSTLFFVTDDAGNGRELWKTDGTAAGTVLLIDISPNNHLGYVSDPIEPKHLANINDTLYFSANDGIHGYELWKSDGTLEGTVLAKDLIPGPKGSLPRDFMEVNGRIFFLANQFDDTQHIIDFDSDYVGDGDPKVWELSKGEPRVVAGDYQLAASLIAVDTTVFFTATSAAGRELWAYYAPGPVTSVAKELVKLHAYPNPTSRFITISLPGIQRNLQYNIIDMLGRVLLSGTSEANDKLNVDLSTLPAGSYLLRFTDFQYKPVRVLKR